MLTTDGRVLARTVRRLLVGSGTDIALLRESIGTPWDPMLGTVVPENNIPMPVPQVFRREVEPLIQEAEPPIVKTRNEGQTVEPKQEREQERAKNLPAEASASSAEPGTSDHDTDTPRQACGICIPGEAVTVKEDDFVVNKVQIAKTQLGHYCFSSTCCAGYAGSAYQSITTYMIVTGCAAGLEIYLLFMGLSNCFFTGLEPRPSGTLRLTGALRLCVFLGDKSARGRLHRLV